MSLVLLVLPALFIAQDRDRPGQLQRDPSKPFSFVWTETQTGSGEVQLTFPPGINAFPNWGETQDRRP